MAADDPDVGAIIDERYQLVERIGVGGMGAVYKAIHVGMGREVAIKVLRPELGNRPEALARFEREAQATAKLAHKNLVAVSDFGVRADGSLYLVMELLRGESLGALLERGPLPWPRAVAIARHVARGLAHAHGHGVIHRDIKPDNIFLVEDEDDPDFAKVLDFGIARSLDGTDATVTQAGLVVGTPAYLAPEQALGGTLDGRSDVYALSIVLYEMLTGQTPFAGREAIAMLTAHAVVDPPPFAEVAPALRVPDGLEAIVMRGLAKPKDARFEDAAELATALDGFRAPSASWAQVADPSRLSMQRPAVAAVSLPALPPAAGIAAWLLDTLPWLRDRERRNRIAVWLGGGLLAVGLLAAIASAVGGPSDAPAPAPAPARPAPAAAAPAAPPKPPPDAIAPRPIIDPDAPLAAIVADLERGKTCPLRKAAVARLRALGDPRAIAPLKKARYRMRGGVLGFGASNANACLKADAEAAIAALAPKPGG